MIEYQEVIQQKWIDKIRRTYQSPIETFDRLGADEIFFYREKLPALSVIMYFPIFLMIFFKGEIVRIWGLMSFCLYYPVLIITKYGTFVQLSAATGAKFYTAFTEHYTSTSRQIDLADQRLMRGCRGLWLYFLVALLSLVLFALMVKTWPYMSGWTRIGLGVFIFFLPYLVVRWVTSQYH